MVRSPRRRIRRCRGLPPLRTPERPLLHGDRYRAHLACRAAHRPLPVPPSRRPHRRRHPPRPSGMRRQRAYAAIQLVCPAARLGMVLQAASSRIPPLAPLQSRMRRRCVPTHAVHLPHPRGTLDQDYLGTTRDFHEIPLQPAPGPHTLTVVDGEGNTASVRFHTD